MVGEKGQRVRRRGGRYHPGQILRKPTQLREDRFQTGRERLDRLRHLGGPRLLQDLRQKVDQFLDLCGRRQIAGRGGGVRSPAS